MTINPVSNDVVRNVDLQAIKESIKNLVMTERGERLFQPELGCDVHSMLFESLTPDLIITAKSMIEDVLTKYEPRIEVENVTILSKNDGIVYITVRFYTLNISEAIEYTIKIDRIR
jgi:hypothetical protein